MQLANITPGTRIRLDGVERIVEWKLDDVVVCAASAGGPYYTHWSTEVAEVLTPMEAP